MKNRYNIVETKSVYGKKQYGIYKRCFFGLFNIAVCELVIAAAASRSYGYYENTDHWIYYKHIIYKSFEDAYENLKILLNNRKLQYRGFILNPCKYLDGYGQYNHGYYVRASNSSLLTYGSEYRCKCDIDTMCNRLEMLNYRKTIKISNL